MLVRTLRNLLNTFADEREIVVQTTPVVPNSRITRVSDLVNIKRVDAKAGFVVIELDLKEDEHA